MEGRGVRCMALLEVIESSSREVAINLFRLELEVALESRLSRA